MRGEEEDYGEQMRHMIYYRRAQRQSEGIVVLSGCLAQPMSNPWFWAALSLCCQRRRATYEIRRRLEGHVQIIFEMLWCIMWKKKQQPLGSRRSLYTIKRDPARLARSASHLPLAAQIGILFPQFPHYS